MFGIKQAYASLFGGYLLFLILLTKFWYPFSGLHRYDFLFIAAVAFQIFLLASRLESPKEAIVIFVFHVVATIMELFKTSDAIGSWKYPEEFHIGLGNVPLFAGFMYSAVGSYIARVWRVFDFRYNRYPPMWSSYLMVAFIYMNFFTHHYMFDLRWPLVITTVVLFGRSNIYFRMDKTHRNMPLVIGCFLVALFIWFAENISTYARIWVYPSQTAEWSVVPFDKLIAWYLLMFLSFVLVTIIHTPQHLDGSPCHSRTSSLETS